MRTHFKILCNIIKPFSFAFRSYHRFFLFSTEIYTGKTERQNQLLIIGCLIGPIRMEFCYLLKLWMFLQAYWQLFASDPHKSKVMGTGKYWQYSLLIHMVYIENLKNILTVWEGLYKGQSNKHTKLIYINSTISSFNTTVIKVNKIFLMMTSRVLRAWRSWTSAHLHRIDFKESI